MYIHQRDRWWEFTYDSAAILHRLGAVRAQQGELLGRMSAAGFDIQDHAMLESMSADLVRSCEIEGESLSMSEVRSSMARRLGVERAALVVPSHYVEGVVEMQLDATQRHDAPLTDQRLFGWHCALFPTGHSGPYKIEVGQYRTGRMQVVSGPMGCERVHYEAPVPERVPEEMARFLAWVNSTDSTDGVLKAAMAHLWFVTIHPFDDGNGRMARAITDMLLARAENCGKRFYSISSALKERQKRYYSTLELTQRGDGDITEWLLFFLECLESAIAAAMETMASTNAKAEFWKRHHDTEVNERQRKIINMLHDGFEGKLTSGKWAKICKCSADTALNDIRDLMGKGILTRNGEGGRSTNYSLANLQTNASTDLPTDSLTD